MCRCHFRTTALVCATASKTKQRRRIALGVLIAVVVCILAVNRLDPGLPDAFPVQFVNDTRGPVELKLCADRACTDFDYSDQLRSGGATEENISTDFVFTRWAVFDAAQRRVGCISLEFGDVAYTQVRVNLSQMVACPDDHVLGPAHFGVRTFGK
jgi:hypothetical protein